MKNPNQIGGRGIYTAIKQRDDAIKKYLENPKYCKCCNSIILAKDNQKVSHARKKSFCNASCAAIFNNKIRPKKERLPKELKIRKVKNEVSRSSKGDLFRRAKNWQSARSCITDNAHSIFFEAGERCCRNCKYDKHIQVCHIKSVSSFPDEAIISDINHLSNLIGLCPNCHWEFDHGLLRLEEIGCGIPSGTEI